MSAQLIVLFDFKDPYSYLALEPTWALIAETGVENRWYPFLEAPMRPVPTIDETADRGARHRRRRALYRQQDLQRYAAAVELPAHHFFGDGLYRQPNGEIAAMGFNWATGQGPMVARQYLELTFAGYWDGELDLDSAEHIEALLDRCGAETDGFDLFCAEEGLRELAAQRDSLVAEGAFGVPSCLLDGEAFLGRQHLPFLAHRIQEGGQ